MVSTKSGVVGTPWGMFLLRWVRLHKDLCSADKRTEPSTHQHVGTEVPTALVIPPEVQRLGHLNVTSVPADEGAAGWPRTKHRLTPCNPHPHSGVGQCDILPGSRQLSSR